jgi:hypothetical protein
MENPNTENQAEEIIKMRESNSLGQASHVNQPEPTTVVEELGWSQVNMSTLPSQGIFYPEGTQIMIRAASGAEIRHWSSLDDEDLLSINDALSRIVDKCCRIRFPKSMGMFKDIKEIDRFFIVFAIRELTFSKGQNSLKVSFTCSCGKTDSQEIRKEMLSYYVPSLDLQKRFSPDEKCFHLKMTNKEEIKLFLPSIGVMKFLTDYFTVKTQAKAEIDRAFFKWAPFLFPEWRQLNEDTYQKAMQDSYVWSVDKISVVDWFVDEMQKAVKPEITHKCSACGTEVTAPLNFRVKSLFLISDIAGKLL